MKEAFLIGSLILSFILSVVCGFIFIPILRRLKAGQTERYNGPQTHLSKNGTPTMGGFIFLVPIAVLSVLVFAFGYSKDILPIMFTVILYGAVGFIDDFLKVVKKNKDGFIWWQKLILLIAISVAFSLYIQYGAKLGTTVKIPLFGLNFEWNLSALFVPLCVFLMVAESNAVNITDGLDGLCAGCVSIVMMFYGVTSYFKFKNTDAAFFSLICLGSLIGFFIFNKHPAKIFMGDTGSLALGAAVGSLAIYLRIPFMLLLVGLLFVIEALSVLLQVSYFKISHGKRIFKMAPIHHHFELSGWSETKVTAVFWAFTFVCCALGTLCVIL